MAHALQMEHDEDPALVIFRKLNMKQDAKGVWCLPVGYDFNGNRVILAVYDRPQKTKGGIILTDRTREEEQNQGKACLVIALGRTAFNANPNYDFAGFRAEVGNWVSVHVYATRVQQVEGYPCRITHDTDIIGTIPGPDSIY